MDQHIEYSLVNKTYGKSNISFENNRYIFNYPCESNSECTNYELFLQRGTYLIELYGASGGFVENHITLNRISKGVCTTLPPKSLIQTNVGCSNLDSVSGAGGYTSGIITLATTTKAFLAIGGQGTYGYTLETSNNAECFLPENMLKGGYNGGGWASNHHHGSGSGGGSTDLRFEKDDVFHRVIVAGAGGGTDDQRSDENDDYGSGGSGGGLIAQSFWTNDIVDKTYVASQTSGFTFGSGESAQLTGSKNPNGANGPDNLYSDRGGSGSGWFGGFASHLSYAGAGGGSSFILTSDAQIPEGDITHHDTFYNVIDTQPYAFSDKQKYLFTNPQMYAGVWAGNGMAIITLLHNSDPKTCQHSKKKYLFQILTIAHSIVSC